MAVKAAEQLEPSRQVNKDWFDTHRWPRTENQQLSVGDLVLLHQTIRSGNRALSMKLQDQWIGPYRIVEVPLNSTFYKLAEFDSTPYKDTTVASNHIKKFFKRSELDTCRQEMHDTIRVEDLPEEDEGIMEDDMAAVGMDEDFPLVFAFLLVIWDFSTIWCYSSIMIR